MEKNVKLQVTGFHTQDGAGVNLVRVPGNGTMKEYDPILMQRYERRAVGYALQK